jgi:CheY-like chemotaxis protein
MRRKVSPKVKQKTVLVIDDEIDVRESLQDALSDEGYAVVLASNGKEALKLLPSLKRPCAIILDVIMPVMGGPEFYEALRADPGSADIPVLISTSDPSRAPGRLPVVRKPVNLDRLLIAVAALF